jgi:hypothetical protein
MHRLGFSAVAVVLLAAGCSFGPSTGTVSGEVTLDGAPLKEGTIDFVPADGKTSSASATITDGKYKVDAVPVGEKIIKISAPRVVGKRPVYDTKDSPTVDEVKELIPEKYNIRSDQKYTVAAGKQEKSFPLTSK